MAAPSAESEHTIEVYAKHEPKLQALRAKRTKPFDAEVLQKVTDAEALTAVLTGNMEMPKEAESQIWMTLGQAIMEAGGSGIRLADEEWSLLDVILAISDTTDDFPVLLLVEVMLASDVHVVQMRGRPVHAGQLYNITYSGWSKMADKKVRARHHLKFGFLLLTIQEPGRAADQLLKALECDPTSNAKELLKKMVGEGFEKTTTGIKLSVSPAGELEIDRSEESPEDDESEAEALRNARSGAAAAVSGLPSSGGAGAAAAQATSAGSSAAAAPMAHGKQRIVVDDADASGSSNALVVAGVVVAAAAIGFAVWRALAAKKQ